MRRSSWRLSAQYRVGAEPRQDPQGVISTTPDLGKKKIVGQEQKARSRSLLSIRLLDVLWGKPGTESQSTMRHWWFHHDTIQEQSPKTRNDQKRSRQQPAKQSKNFFRINQGKSGYKCLYYFEWPVPYIPCHVMPRHALCSHMDAGRRCKEVKNAMSFYYNRDLVFSL